MNLFILIDWRPKRSIIFCSWGAEEASLIGSVEFVEVTGIIFKIKGVKLRFKILHLGI